MDAEKYKFLVNDNFKILDNKHNFNRPKFIFSDRKPISAIMRNNYRNGESSSISQMIDEEELKDQVMPLQPIMEKSRNMR